MKRPLARKALLDNSLIHVVNSHAFQTAMADEYQFKRECNTIGAYSPVPVSVHWRPRPSLLTASLAAVTFLAMNCSKPAILSTSRWN